jgi:ABC-type transport system involved in cytochrome bd biosynthesis fused ATPase/permease subunit
MLAQDRPPQLLALVEESAAGQIFNKRRQRLTGRNRHCATLRVLQRLREVGDQSDANSNEIYTLQFRRLQQLKRIRSFVRLRTLTEIWLLFHVPMSIALLVALIAHIVSVFFYW